MDVGPPTLITGVITKGRADSKKQHWVTRFKISYSNDTNFWYTYKDAHHAEPRVSNSCNDPLYSLAVLMLLCYQRTKIENLLT